jgi:Mannosyl-3-phosphoglycerate synthase (osmo_MPGsynth)
VRRDNNIHSSRSPVDRFEMEVEAVRQLGGFTDKRMVIAQQQDSGFAEVFKKVGYN